MSGFIKFYKAVGERISVAFLRLFPALYAIGCALVFAGAFFRDILAP